MHVSPSTRLANSSAATHDLFMSPSRAGPMCVFQLF